MSRRFQRLITWITVVTDAILINLAFALAYWVRYDLQWFRPVDEVYYTPYWTYIPISLALTGILLASYGLEGVYRPSRGRSWFDEVYTIFSGTTTGIVLMVAVFYFYQPQYHSRLIFIYALVLITTLLGLSRLVKHSLLDRFRRRGVGVDRVLIVGAGEVGRTVMRNLVARPELGYQVVGYVDDDPQKGSSALGRFPGLGGLDRLPELLASGEVDEVIITLPWMYHRKILNLVAQCQRAKVRVRIVPDVFQMRLTHVDVDDLSGIPLIGLRDVAISGWKLFLKRAIDVVGAVVGLIVLSPLMACIALAIRLETPGSPIYRQTRIGRGGRPFTLYKFRSMYEGAEEERDRLAPLNEADGPLFKIRDDPRVTRVGRVLRRLSLDELPQLYNVLRGEMSLVGPRPPLPEEVAQYQDWHKRRLEVAPGMTGLWQVSGRSELTFDEMVMLDLYYIENWSLGLDFRIALRTIPRVILGYGAY
ncbi:MAG: undecaprenyl-phosphate glucose phosphotransferase [Anaerolineae bacterium]